MGIIFFYGAIFSYFFVVAALIVAPVIYFRGTRAVRRIFGVGVRFGVSMFLMTLLFSIAWEKFVDEEIYDCTDPAFGYLTPDGWVGGNNFPVVTVKQVVSGRSMSEPDEIKEGWSVEGLWALWWLFFGTSLVISTVFALWPDRADKSLFDRLRAKSSPDQAVS